MVNEILLGDILEPPLQVGLLWSSLNLNGHGRWDILSNGQHVVISQFHFYLCWLQYRWSFISAIIFFRLTILYFEVMYWFFDVWRLLHWKSGCLALVWMSGKVIGLFQTVSRLFRPKNMEVKFFFNSLLARLTNHPYMAFPNLGPPLQTFVPFCLLTWRLQPIFQINVLSRLQTRAARKSSRYMW